MGPLERRLFLKLLGAAAVAACSTPGEEEAQTEGAIKDGEIFDYIVIGSGAGGGPIAANLAKAKFRVLLLEAGSDHGDRTTYKVPAFHPQSSEDPAMTWEFWVQHYSDEAKSRRDLNFQDFTEKEPDKKGILYPRAGTLGGCTAHNAMITVYPHASDWDDLAELTRDKTWGSVNMRKYFKLVENCGYLGNRPSDEDKKAHGFDGWLPTNLADPSILLKKLDARLLAVIKAAAVAFSNSEAGFEGLASILENPLRVAELPLALKNVFDELVGLLKRDLNNASPGRDQTEGLFSIPQAMKNGRRAGTRELLKETERLKPNHLFIETEALVSRIILDEKLVDGKLRASGVQFMKGGNLYRAHRSPDSNPNSAQRLTANVTAKGEVIVAAGVYNTPQLLMLSGIGPKSQIGEVGQPIALNGDARDRGVIVRKNLEGVGKNLQDRYEVGVVTKTSKDFRVLDTCTFGVDIHETKKKIQLRTGRFGIKVPVLVDEEVTRPDPCLGEWERGTGPYAGNGAVAAIVKKSKTADGDPDLIIFCVPGAFRGYQRDYSQKLFPKDTGGTPDKSFYTWAILKGHTRNTAGDVRLRTANPWDLPAINFRYFDESNPENAKDLAAMVEGIEFVRQINDRAAPVLRAFGEVTEELPGRQKDLATFVKENAWGHHASCTCPIGAEDKGGVVDSNLVVHGTKNLRVVDASVFPKIPGFFIVTSIYTMSEKATDDVLEAAGRPRRIERPRET
jgi:choline dehydrogenase